jgi:hypothetical protein
LRGEHFDKLANRASLYPVVVTNPNTFTLAVQCTAGDGNTYAINVPANSIAVVVNWTTAATNDVTMLYASPTSSVMDLDPIIINDPTGS